MKKVKRNKVLMEVVLHVLALSLSLDALHSPYPKKQPLSENPNSQKKLKKHQFLFIMILRMCRFQRNLSSKRKNPLFFKLPNLRLEFLLFQGR